MTTKTMQSVPVLLMLAALAGIFIETGCWTRADDHCGNLLGDQTCDAQGAGRYCNICRVEDNGCVDQMPPDECHFDAPSETTAATDSSVVEATSDTEAGPTPDEGEPEPPMIDSTSTGGATTSIGDEGGMDVNDETTGAETPSYPSCSSDEQCEDPYNLCYPYFQSGEISFCTLACGDESRCPLPDSGTATPVCILPLGGVAQCVLDCGTGETCPDGMSCYSVVYLGLERWRCGW